MIQHLILPCESAGAAVVPQGEAIEAFAERVARPEHRIPDSERRPRVEDVRSPRPAILSAVGGGQFRRRVTTIASALGLGVDHVDSTAAALAHIVSYCYDVALLDLEDPEALHAVPKFLAAAAHLRIIGLVGERDYALAFQAVKTGVVDCLPKSASRSYLRERIARSLGERPVQAAAGADRAGALVTSRTPALRNVCALVARAATTDVPVLLLGESGTGKSAVASLLHASSARAASPFVTVNCPNLNDELLASELFGHVRGAFTGAVRDQLGKVEACDGGTLFLDELGELSATVQAKLLRFLQERTYERLGEAATRSADVRIIAATNRDIHADTTQGRFRDDLLYRLDVIEIRMPPLRERKADIPDLCRHFLAGEAGERQGIAIDPGAMEVLVGYAWPGNIRELRNELRRAAVMCRGQVIRAEDLSPRVFRKAEQPPRVGDLCSLCDIEREHIRQILAKSPSIKESAEILGIEPSTLWRKRMKFGIGGPARRE